MHLTSSREADKVPMCTNISGIYLDECNFKKVLAVCPRRCEVQPTPAVLSRPGGRCGVPGQEVEVGVLDGRGAPSPAAPGVGAAGLCGTNRVCPGVDVESERDSVSPEPCCFNAPSRQSGGCWKSLMRGPAVLTSSAIPKFELQTSHRIPERRFWVLHLSLGCVLHPLGGTGVGARVLG